MEKLKKEFDVLTGKKRLKLKQAEVIAGGFVKAQDEIEGLKHALKLEQERNKIAERPGSKSRVISEEKLSKVAGDYQNFVKKCLLKYTTLVLVNGMLECTSCRDDWEVAGLPKQPLYRFKPNVRVDGSVKRHFLHSANHLLCSRAREKYNSRKDFYQQNILRFKAEANVMTENVLRAVYFLLINDLSINLYESLIELLDCCKTMIGNQLHSYGTARQMALTIDEMFQGAFVRFLASDKVEDFAVIGDELTDVGGLKVLLSKLRFFENDWDLQEMTFSIFESTGTSEELANAFTDDFVNQFTKHSDLTEEEVLDLLCKKLFSGGSDRASKMLKFGDIMRERLDHYVHFKCDNHVSESA